jgi:DNA polymerase-3 subunit delta'
VWYGSVFEPFHGNSAAADTLAQMIRQDRIPQTILLSGPEGIGKATLVRRFAAELLGERDKIERDDLSLPENVNVIADREKLPADKRADDPLLFASHMDFVTFAPDGPLRQISIQQIRLLKERAQFGPLRGRYRVFLIDRIDRANEQAANSLLKITEEPPAHLLLFMTAENAYDLLPTIRSRSLMLSMSPLSTEEMAAFVRDKGLKDEKRRVALASGSPGVAVCLDLEAYDKRRAAMITLLKAASGVQPFGTWAKVSESLSRTEKLENHLNVLYSLLEDVLFLQNGTGELRNADVRKDLEEIARRASFDWMRKAVCKTDELVELLRRNIQKSIALDAMVVELRAA